MNSRTLIRLAMHNPRQALAMLREEEHRNDNRRRQEEHMDFATQLMKRTHDVRRKAQL